MCDLKIVADSIVETSNVLHKSGDIVQCIKTIFICRHAIKQNRWINFKLTQLSDASGDIEYGASLRDATSVWLNSANSTNPVQFLKCHVPRDNEMK